MANGISNALQAAVVRLLRPLVRLMLRNGISYGVFADVAKRIYVDVAMQEFAIPGRKPSVSRASVITGLSRKEVLRVSRLADLSDDPVQDRYNRAVRVISGWMRDAAYQNAQGAPMELPLEGDSQSFSALVRQYSGDAPVRAVLDELLRVRAIERLPSGAVRLLEPAYIPLGDLEDKIAILGTDVSDLVTTIDHNLEHAGTDSRFQLKVAYDNIPQEVLHRFRSMSSEEAFRLLQSLDRELATLDRDANPDIAGTGRMRAGMGIYYFEENLSDEAAHA